MSNVSLCHSFVSFNSAFRLGLRCKATKQCRHIYSEGPRFLSLEHTYTTRYDYNLSIIKSPKVSKGAKIRNRYNQVPHLTQDTNGKVTNSQLDTTNESQEVSPFPAGDHKAHINRRAQRHSKHKTEQKHKRSTKEVPPWANALGTLWPVLLNVSLS